MLAALDLNADRGVAVRGPGSEPAQVVTLAAGEHALPLALSLEKRVPEIGRAGLALSRKSPQFACVSYLPQVARPRTWRHGRKRLTALDALRLTCARIKERLHDVKGLGLTLPGYLQRDQVDAIVAQVRKCGLPVTGALPRSLAAAMHSYAEHPWHNVGIVVDVDDHALTLSLFRPGDVEMLSLGQQTYPLLGLKQWRNRLLSCIAETCIQVSRRDPRASPEADQMVFDQLEDVLDASSQGRPTILRVNGVQWFQTLTFTAAAATAACAPLARQTAHLIESACQWAEAQLTTAAVYFTAATARLPGLAAATYERSQNRLPVSILSPQAAALAAFEIAVRIDRKELPSGLFEATAPLPVLDRSEQPDMLPFPTKLRPVAREPS